MPLTARIRTIAMKTEVTKGVPIASGWDENDAPMSIFDANSPASQETQEQEPYSQALGFDPDIVTVRSRSFSWETKFVGSGDVAIPPPWAIALRACGFAQNAMDSVAIGPITGGPFLIGEGVTSSGGASGLVAVTTFSGATVLYIVPILGTFGNSETLTGAVSGATATTTAAEISGVGFQFKPISRDADIDSLHLRDYNDGMLSEAAGCRGNMTLRGGTGETMRMAFEFEGKDIGESDEAVVDSSEPDREGPRLAAANLRTYLDDGNPFVPDADSLELSTGGRLSLSKNFNDPTGAGYSYARIGQRRGTGSLDALAELVATHPFHEIWSNVKTGVIEFSIGDTPGNQFLVQAPNAQYSEPSKGERDDLSNISLGLSLNRLKSTGSNNELVILAL